MCYLHVKHGLDVALHIVLIGAQRPSQLDPLGGPVSHCRRAEHVGVDRQLEQTLVEALHHALYAPRLRTLNAQIGIIIVGFPSHGLHFLSFLLHKGVPLALAPLKVVLELISYGLISYSRSPQSLRELKSVNTRHAKYYRYES